MVDQSTPGITWFEMAQWPVNVGFTASEKSFKREMKRLGLVDGPPFTPGRGGALHRIKAEGEPTAFIVCINDLPDYSEHQKAAMIAHECVHAAQFLWEDIGEQNPGREAEAYLIQHLVQSSLYALEAQRLTMRAKSKQRKA